MKRWVGPVAIFFSVVCLLILCLYDMQKSSSPGEASQKHEEAGWSLAKQAVSHQEVNGTNLEPADSKAASVPSPDGSKSDCVFGITQVILRTEPGADQAQVGVLEKNEKADRLSQEAGQWDKIRLEDGTEGFVPNALLTTWLPVDGQMDIVHIVDEQEPAPPAVDSEYFAILAPARATVDQARAWAESKGATETFLGLAEVYWSISPSVGVDPAVAYAQSAKETNFGKFTGVLDETYKNPCGMKRTETGKPEDSDDFIAEAHKRFDSWEDGISAHVDHLALYAGAAGYPKEGTLDPRHFESLFGRCPTVESLGGNWAPSEDYGVSLRGYVEAMMGF
ncbi:glucosaminidase domain-containing protein [Bianquea renquensis]|nr:glucosaminidase domain-containing protein [Bianquea renquensis]